MAARQQPSSRLVALQLCRLAFKNSSSCSSIAALQVSSPRLALLSVRPLVVITTTLDAEGSQGRHLVLPHFIMAARRPLFTTSYLLTAHLTSRTYIDQSPCMTGSTPTPLGRVCPLRPISRHSEPQMAQQDMSPSPTQQRATRPDISRNPK